jgi:hypothetical protein
MPLAQTQFLLEWIRTEAARRSLKPTEMLDHLRKEVRRLVLADSTGKAAAEADEGPPG